MYYSSWFSLILVKTLVAVLTLVTSRAAAGLIEVWVQEKGTTFAFWRYSFALKVSFILILGCINTFSNFS